MPWVMMDDFFLYRNRPNIGLREAAALERRMRGRAIVNPSVGRRSRIKYASKTIEDVQIVGTTEKQVMMTTTTPQAGRFLMPFDVTFRKHVCVIGTEIRDGLFKGLDPVNRTLRIGRVDYRIVGVMEKQGGGFMGGPNFDRQIYIPITTFLKDFGGTHRRINVSLAVKAPSQEGMADFEYELIGEMRKIRSLRPAEADNFSINKLDTLVGTFNSLMGVVLIVGLIVTSLSLFVGAVGVMNIMLVSVTERTREIGIRKAIGATKRSILAQFLFEAAAICLVGGGVGIALSAGVAALLNATLMPASLSLPIVGVAVLVSILVGVTAGVAPAWRGARLDPVEALRYE